MLTKGDKEELKKIVDGIVKRRIAFDFIIGKIKKPYISIPLFLILIWIIDDPNITIVKSALTLKRLISGS